MTHLVLFNALKGLRTNTSLVLRIMAQSFYSIIPHFISYFPNISTIFLCPMKKSATLTEHTFNRQVPNMNLGWTIGNPEKIFCRRNQLIEVSSQLNLCVWMFMFHIPGSSKLYKIALRKISLLEKYLLSWLGISFVIISVLFY